MMRTKQISLAHRCFLAAFIVGLVLPTGSRSQGAQVEVGENVQVSLPHAGLINTYVTVAADPTDARRLLAGANIWDDPTKNGAVHVGVYQSSDGGKTWAVSLEEPKQSTTSDCTIAFGRAGNVYVADVNGDSPGWRLFHSGNAGRTWKPPTFNPDNVDRPFLSVDNTAGPYAGHVYCAAVVFADALGGTGGSLSALGLYHSSNNGKTVETPVLRVAGRPFYMSGTGNCVVLSDGTLITLYGFHTDKWNAEMQKADPNFQPKEGAYIGIGRSHDGGRTFEKKMQVISSLFLPLWHGEVYGTIAADPESKEFRDRLYVVWTTHIDSRDQVMFAQSADGGKTWSLPVPIADQEMKQEEHGFDAVLPCVAVNKAGVVAVTWYDTRGLKNRKGWNVRLRASLDGGVTWQPSVRVSSVTSDFNGKLVPGTTQAKDEGNDLAGHTSGLVADADGAFHAVWVDNRTGIRQVWTATVKVHSKP